MKAFKLENEPKIKTGFKTPDHYFDDFSVKVLQQINERETKVIPIYKRKKVITVLAAAVVVIALMIPIVHTYNKSKELDEATLETYLSYESNLNQYDLIRELDTKDIEAINKNVVLEQETLEDVLSSNPNIESLISE
jgi:predicted histidine transporter YuiF (NhaC family)